MDDIPLQGKATRSTISTVAQTPKTRPWSFRKTYRDSATDERIYLCVALTEAVTVTVLALAAFIVMVTRMPPSNKQTIGVSVYMAIFVLGRIFSLAYSLDAIRSRNIIQLVHHIFFQVCMFVYAVAEIPQTRSALKNLNDPGGCLIRNGDFDCLGRGSLYYLLLNILIWPIIITAVATAAYIVLVRRLTLRFGWEECRIVNANYELRRMYRTYSCMVSLLKLLMFFASAFCMAYIVLITVLWKNKVDIIITIVALPIFYPTILATGWALLSEDFALMIICLVLLLVGEAYLVYKMASLWVPRTAKLYTSTRATLAVLSAFAIVLLLAVIVNGIACLFNFGKGLLPAHQERRRRSARYLNPLAGQERELETRLVIE
ncbi:hypothetical protein CcaverHIS002_0201120 [Cutaneotrichosporon cavernicola]|uniref:Uncharacterized protein n=1 Tax=Cutaneotrichosporon cavernicola TaxID=279322 RepID=A0AA48I7Z2_9TREE|nr:uncharacterized protein CcaverHIS019_0201170 [Cutaneotrichosporon cavernicola]BEI80952.1 hypothetical protein CcaverHIS002_0201120 [Cutaneotrichosporon cavernicola]BEI88755.1 hypothetical protein CcaverHIS019_0201170 [Cutaneotrichosporon cavernicola]